MKKIIKSILVLTVSLLTISFTNVQAQETYSVALVQLVSHPSLDDIAEGIYEGLAEAGYVEGDNLEVDFYNIEGDLNLLSTVAQQAVSKNPDLIITIATQTTQAFQNVTSDIPIIMSGITDPLAAKLVADLEEPGANITGVSNKVSFEEQLDLLLELKPEVEKIGMIYTTSEDNTTSEIQQAAEIAEAAGFEVQVEGISSTIDLSLVAENLAADVDAIYIGSDNTIASAFENLVTITDQFSIPVFSTVDTFVQQGALSAVAINQKDIGLETATIAAEVLEGADPATYPVFYFTELDAVINYETAAKLGISVPEELDLIDIKDRFN